jgi:hypothetical protein
MFINIEGALSAMENLGNKFAFRHFVHKDRKLRKEEIIAVLKAGQSRGYKTTNDFAEGEIDIILDELMGQNKPIYDRGYKSDGTKEKGKRIIDILEGAGGINVHNHDGSMQDLFYYINEKREIAGNIVLPEGYFWYTLDGASCNVWDDYPNSYKVVYQADGTETRGKKIIEILENDGGVNKHGHKGMISGLFYGIHSNNEITAYLTIPKGYTLIDKITATDNSSESLDDTKQPSMEYGLPFSEQSILSLSSIEKYTEYVELLNRVLEFMKSRQEVDFDPRTPMFMADFYLHMTKDQAPADINNDTLKNVLSEAILQIEYLHQKYKPTGSGEKVLAMIRNYKQSLA